FKEGTKKFRASCARTMTSIRPAERPLAPFSLDEDYALRKAAWRDAGARARTYFRRSILVKRKMDGTEVSEADLAGDRALKLDLLTKRADYGWLCGKTGGGREG